MNIESKLDFVCGSDAAAVQGYAAGNKALVIASTKWSRGEFSDFEEMLHWFSDSIVRDYLDSGVKNYLMFMHGAFFAASIRLLRLTTQARSGLSSEDPYH